ncbi:MAG: DUF6798 domain-containing protein, partial [Pirellulales bacterium]
SWRESSFDVLLILLVFLISAAWPVPDVNEPHYLCKAKHYWNPEWCANDFFLASADAHLVFYWTAGWLTRWLSLPAVAWVGRLVSWTFLAWSWRRLSYSLVPRPLYAALSAALWVTLMTWFHLAGEWVVGGFEAKGIAFGFILLGIEAVVRGRWNRAWLLMGIATAFHVLVGGWSLLLVGWVWLTAGRDRPSIPAMLPGLVAGLVASLPGLVPALLLTRGVDPDIVRQANHIYVFIRLPHHLALHTLKAAELTERITRFAPQVLLFVGLCYVLPATPARRRLWQFVFGALLIAWLGLCISLATWNHPDLAAGILRYYWYRMADVALPTGIALSVVAGIASRFPSRGDFSAATGKLPGKATTRHTQLAAWGLAVSLCFAGFFLGKTVTLRHEDPRPRADRKTRDADAWRDACAWIAENTPEDALFLIPRHAQTFKWRAGRAEVANYKDVPQDARSLVEWWQRIDALYRFDSDEGQRKYRRTLAQQGDQRLKELAARYGARYLVTERKPPLGFKMLYDNRRYVVYRIPLALDPQEQAGTVHAVED